MRQLVYINSIIFIQRTEARTMVLRCCAIVLFCTLAVTEERNALHGQTGKNLGNIGRFAKWSKIEISLSGAASKAAADPNPFNIRVDVVFTGPSGKKYLVPAFYNGDGRGGPDGNIWHARFSADETGKWLFKSQSLQKLLDGHTGSFVVAKPSSEAKGFWKWGRLESVGTVKNKIRYLKFRDGPYWLKAGCDDPENFLGAYRNYNTLAKRKAAIDYLADRGVNSLYMMTHNIGGDDNDVWPWLGKNAAQAKRNGGKSARFDIAKLEQWRELFEYMHDKGVVPYLVLEDDSAWKGYDHKRYYRELIARFGYLPALIFNFNEEYNENYRLSQALDYMRMLKQLDPFNHPRGIHNVNRPVDQYIDSPYVDFTAIQTKGGNPLIHNSMAIAWIKRCRARGKRTLMVNFDEGRPEENRKGWWSAYLGGGVWEVHVRQPYDRPLSSWEPAWTQLGGARRFMESIPFWEMDPRNDLVISGKALCLAKTGKAYALYLPSGGRLEVKLMPNTTYSFAWWNPANGKEGRFQNNGKTIGSKRLFRAPGDSDWALRITKTN